MKSRGKCNAMKGDKDEKQTQSFDYLTQAVQEQVSEFGRLLV